MSASGTQASVEQTVQWRAEELEKAGFTPGHSEKLAARFDIDLHKAVELIKGGCPEPLAYKILH